MLHTPTTNTIRLCVFFVESNQVVYDIVQVLILYNSVHFLCFENDGVTDEVGSALSVLALLMGVMHEVAVS
jgi:hypothetical protein